MKNTLIEAKIESVKRLNNTVYGNPMYEVMTGLGKFKTAGNAGYVYGINWNNIEGKKALIELGSRGTIINLEV